MPISKNAERVLGKKEKNITFAKRKRGLIKKCIEISQLCDLYLHLAIFDQVNQKVVEFCSHEEFTAYVVTRLLDPDLPSKIVHEKYTNKDLDSFVLKETKGPLKKEDDNSS